MEGPASNNAPSRFIEKLLGHLGEVRILYEVVPPQAFGNVLGWLRQVDVKVKCSIAGSDVSLMKVSVAFPHAADSRDQRGRGFPQRDTETAGASVSRHDVLVPR